LELYKMLLMVVTMYEKVILSWILVTDIDFRLLKFFDSVQIDSTFYKILSKFIVNNWNERTLEN